MHIGIQFGLFALAGSLVLAGCGSPRGPEAGANQRGDADFERITFGGRLFDMWYDDIDTDFVPDDPDTPTLDGQGGPNGNGTLNDADGRPIPNNGHSYRLKNLFGWDMRGDAGIYGANYQAKEFILPSGPLSPQHADASREDWIRRVTNGDGGLPAYGDVMNAIQIEALVDYMLAVRDGDLPHPDGLYRLSADAPMGFVLVPGGNTARGHAFYDAQCAECHGADSTKVMFDNGEQSLGQHGRYYGYAVAMITLAGEPGSEMGPQLAAGLSADEQTQTLLDLLAALCDRTRYGIGPATDPDVPDGDARCGDYLR